MKYILPILFMAGTVLAQVPIQRREPWFAGHSAAGPDIPTSLGGIAFRLRASDLVVSNNVATWVDEIAGRTYTNNNASTQPTNSWNLGVFFKAGNFLSNNIAVLGSWVWQPTQQVFIAYQAISPANYGSILGNGGAEDLIGYSTAPNNFGNVLSTQTKWINSYPVSAVNYVILSCGGNAPEQAMSNGVTALTFTATGQGFNCDLLGANQHALVDTYQGYIKEIIIWTNQNAFTFSPYAGSQASNLYYYASNVPPSKMGPYIP